MTEKSKIGDPGSPDNVGRASRAAHIKIDKARVRKYDLNWRAQSSPALKMLALSVAAGALGAWLILLLTWWGIALGTVVGGFAIFAFWSCWDDLRYVLSGHRYEMYWDSLLCGAVVLKEDPLTVVALMDANTGGGKVYKRFDADGREVSSEEYEAQEQKMQAEWNEKWEPKYVVEQDPLAADRMLDEFWDPFYERYKKVEDKTAGKWACVVSRVADPEKGDWSYRAGDRIPCSSAFGSPDRERGVWRMVQVIPLIWGTKNAEDLKLCVDAVSAYEWKLMGEIAPLVGDLEKDKVYLIHRSETGGFEFEALNAYEEEEETEEETND